MRSIPFYKMSATGNDFIIIDNRKEDFEHDQDLPQFVANVCKRKVSVGADGFILIENSDNADFKWRFYNSDGSVAEMCGNGARCAARFACMNNIADPKLSFETIAGVVSAEVSNELVKIKMTDPFDFKPEYEINLKTGPIKLGSINTGVPHVVISVDDIDKVDLVRIGREIRFHEEFAPAGTNVNFVHQIDEKSLVIRTYERGVEDETLACGTGAVASALVMSHKAGVKSPVKVLTKSGGFLIIHFKEKKSCFFDIYLEGDARIIYKGELLEDAWKKE